MNKLLIIFISLIIFSGCSNSGGSDSPANSIKDFALSVKQGNTSKAWSVLSTGSQTQFDNVAKKRNLSGNEMFQNDYKNVKSLGDLSQDFEVTDEKKEGDNAQVTVRFANGKNSVFYSVKEGSGWRYDLAKTNQEMMKLVE